MERGHDRLARLRARREQHLERGRAYRIGFAVVGFALVLGGIALIPLPGPGLAIIALGLFMLALEFAWAERLLERAVTRLDAVRERARRGPRE